MTDTALELDVDDESSSGSHRGRLVGAAILVAIIVAGLSFAAGWLSTPRVSNPTTTSAEAGFSRDMQVHHAQAVEMAMIIRDQTDDPAIRTLAYDIATGQSNQAGQMYSLLAAWGLPQNAPEAPMAWMERPALDGTSGHGHGSTASAEPSPGGVAPVDEETAASGVMPGMATAAQLNELRSLTGVEAERLFLELMIAHHIGGVQMAEALLARSDNPLVVSIANGIVFAQTGEIGYMEDLLAERE